MCTEFERSTYWILQLLNDECPTPEDQIDNTLDEEHPEMLLGAGNTLEDVLDSLCTVNVLTKNEAGYLLTPGGLRLRERLHQMVEDEAEGSSMSVA
jgi:hypothetical protein